ncbi:SDR family oxidoreductase [Paraburkholderia sabiae]|jgi:NAD(P)-dependent dehydrogenase (short-subunit alcohol dehydrogenase family)|uniref:SDR family oxidoreductase n=1 Tax=Paraburkholderia sabiae TaxID=273251 RepID=A0ABU9QBG9_9BURK|nr:SDR family oxidoreductase [Paraburkholderia sabiae]WJZ71494.1 SDR family oxidoreductase [Paraburkholderia sabiae]CAD6543721.1 Sorbitol dehydrogenase [Paraburkholderia sabiae]CAG9189912.1 SDR family NAD(P)-dependent oxidoreductase [Paraburkholderia sabiae]
MKPFDSKVAIVTGGSQGLGAAIAALFVERGARGIVICGRAKEKGEAKARELSRIGEAHGAKVVFVQADLANVDDCRNVVASADQHFGRVDVLVNAAAMTDRGTILDTDPALFDSIFATNVRAPFFLMQETIRVMLRERIEGTIVNIGSMSAKAGQPFISAYCASKGALATLTQNTAYALLRNRIRVNGLNLGWMASDGEDRIQREYHGAADDWLQQAAAAQPFGRLIDPAEAARAVAFLASAESGLMTGSIVNYDQSIWGAFEDAPHPAEPMKSV